MPPTIKSISLVVCEFAGFLLLLLRLDSLRVHSFVEHFQNFSWAAHKTFEFGSPISKSVPEPNVAFDEQYVLAQVNFGNSKLTFGLDTEARLLHSRRVLPRRLPILWSDQDRKERKLKPKSDRLRGSIPLFCQKLPFGSWPSRNSASSAHSRRLIRSGCRFGDLGMDLLKQSQNTAIDFKAMTLTMY